MKKLSSTLCLTLLLVFLSGNQNLFSQWSSNWKWSMGTPWGNDVRSIQMISADEWIGFGFIAGMIKTTDAGNTWTSRGDVTNYTGWDPPHIRSSWFFDSNNGIIVGDSALVTGLISRTTDGGSTWSENVRIPSTVINDIKFVDNNTGYVVGNVGKGYKTTDAGLNWTPMTMGGTQNLNAVYPLDANNIYAAGQSGRFFKSTDGGTTWANSATALTSIIFSVYFKNTDTGFVAGSSGAFQITTNGGASWTSRPAPTTSNFMSEIQFNDPDIYLSGDVRRIFKSSNYGVTWDTLNFSSSAVAGNVTGQIYTFDKTGSSMLIGGVSGLMYRSTDNGSSWTSYTTALNNNSLQGIYASSMSGKIWVVGTTGPTSVLYSSNGGANWSPNFGGARRGDYRDVEFLDDNTGYICGSGGTILRTSTGGLSWDSIPSLTTQAANTISIIDNNVVLVGCNGGRLYRSTNGGLNFTVSMIGTASQQFTEFSFPDPNNGWAVMSRDVLKTTDKGSTWSTLYTHTTTLLSISMVDANTGYASGNSGALLKTTTGGLNWTPLSSPIPNNLSRIDFPNATTGFAVSPGAINISGSAIKTTNGGSTWQIINSGSNPLVTVLALSPDSAIAVGIGGNIVKYSAPSSGFNFSLKMNFELCSNQDTITVELRSNVAPYNLIESKIGLGGQGVPVLFNFATISNGTPYFIVVKNRNAIETWSSSAVSFSGNSLSYDFTTAASQAYGNNMTNPGSMWSFYQGDINQDGEVNLTDIVEVFNNASNYVAGPYVITDLNCDGIVDLTDLIATFNNSSNFVKVEKPL